MLIGLVLTIFLSFSFHIQGEPGAPGNKGDTGAKGEPVSTPPSSARTRCLPGWLHPAGAHPSASFSRVLLASRVPPAPLVRKAREEPAVSPAPLGFPVLLAKE